MGRRTLLVCRGSHCRKKLARNGRVVRTLERLDVELETVGCQKVCRGPVIGARVAGGWEWFERVRSRKALGALEQLVEEGTLAKPLRRRRRKDRAGKRRG